MSIHDQGITPNRYTLIPRTLIFLVKGSQVLLLRGAPQKRRWANLYNGIGGHLEPGEDALSSARRELLEETGLVAGNLWLCGIIVIDTGSSPGIGLYVFKGAPASGELHPSEEGALEWVESSQVDNLPLVEDLTTLLPRVLAWQPGEIPFHALYSYDEEGKLKIFWVK